MLPVFAMGPQFQQRFFNSFQKYHWKDTNKILKKNTCMCKIWMGFLGQIFIELETSLVRGFLQLPLWWPLGNDLWKHAGGHSVTNEACTSLAWVCVIRRSGSSLELSALCLELIFQHPHKLSDKLAKHTWLCLELWELEVYLGQI